MDAYPEDYIVQNLPLILLSGLEAESNDESESVNGNAKYPLLREKGIEISSDFPPLSGDVAEELRGVLLEEDASQAPWNFRNDVHGKSTGVGVKIKSVGRVGRQIIIPRAVQLLSSPFWPYHRWAVRGLERSINDGILHLLTRP